MGQGRSGGPSNPLRVNSLKMQGFSETQKSAALSSSYRSAKKDENTDKEMLLDWKEAKLRAIQSGRSKIIVGHKDILIKT